MQFAYTTLYWNAKSFSENKNYNSETTSCPDEQGFPFEIFLAIDAKAEMLFQP